MLQALLHFFSPKLCQFLKIVLLSLKYVLWKRKNKTKTKQVQIIYLLLKKHDIFSILSYALTLLLTYLLHLIQD